MRNGKQVRTTTKADRRNDAERGGGDDMDVDREDNFITKMNEIVASTRRKGKSDFQAKKNAIFKRAREHNGQLSREILASVHEARALLEGITAEKAQNRSMEDLITMLSRRDDAMASLIEEFGTMPAEVSPIRSTVINSASSTLQEQQDFYEESRRKIVGGAKRMWKKASNDSG
ncbi:hypothetical protein BJ322DRAFT_1115103 [Thelephora terrestris]|uniref:Uncharacterized protein n=1 Tax=Thelephora terrestris TaxID=56493 RepID=A0A9P6L0L8_9AGAM|nr:hypothetical protein BJ322DRAFT_1115103 [Thelephora terrestris]